MVFGMTHALIPVLQSSRLTLQALCEADRALLLAMAHDAEVTRHLHKGSAPSAEDVSNRVARALRQWHFGVTG